MRHYHVVYELGLSSGPVKGSSLVSMEGGFVITFAQDLIQDSLRYQIECPPSPLLLNWIEISQAEFDADQEYRKTQGRT